MRIMRINKSMEGLPRFAFPKPTRVEEPQMEIGPNGTSLQLLQTVYRKLCRIAGTPFETFVRDRKWEWKNNR